MSERTPADDSRTTNEFGSAEPGKSAPVPNADSSDTSLSNASISKLAASNPSKSNRDSSTLPASGSQEAVESSEGNARRGPATDDSPSPRNGHDLSGSAQQDNDSHLDTSEHHDFEVIISEAVSSQAPAERFESTHGMSSLPADSAQEVSEASFDDEPTVITERKDHSPDSVGRFSTRELGAALVGTQLQHYQLVEFVGGGGMGAVFRANDLKLGRTVAVKVLARTGPNGELAKRFINEAQSAAQLDHENIARVYNVDESGGLSYIVFEFVEGVNLREAVSTSGPLSIEQTLRYAIQITEALDHAAQRKVIHRDIKPSNILITHSGKIKLVDMGLARMSRVDANDPELTESGMTLGTFDYISPEQARDPRRADIRSDLYSLGCTLHFMLTGKPPFPDGTAFEKLLHHREGKRPDPRRERPEVPHELSLVIRRLMATNPAQRFQTPGELLAALTWMGQKWGLSLSTSPSVERAMARYIARRTWAQHVLPVAVPALVLTLLIVVVELLTERQYPAAELVAPQYATRLEPAAIEPEGSDPASSAPIDENTPSRGDETGDESSRSVDSPADRNGETKPSDSSDPDSVGGSGSAVETFDGDIFPNAGETWPSPSMRPRRNDVEPGPMRDRDRGALWNGGTKQPESLTPQPLEDATVEYIRVTRDANPESANQLAVKSLSEALTLAGSFPNLKAIQLDFDGEMLVSPLTLTQRSMTVEAATGRRPLLRFAPKPVEDQAAMMSFEGQRLEWKGIDFVWDLSGGLNPEERTFLRINQVGDAESTERVLKFSDCTFTVRRYKDVTLVPTEEQSLIRIAEPQNFVRGTFLPSRLEPPTIQLENCSVRGSVALVSTPRATPYTLTWRSGLFISDRRLIESQGAKSRAVPFRATIDLEQVTVASMRGLARLTVSEKAPEQLELLFNARQCIFEIHEPNALIEHVGVIGSPEDLLDFTADRCLLPDRSPIWVMRSLLDPAPAVVYEFEDAIEGDRWFADKSCERASRVKWDQSPADRADLVWLRTIDDYRLLDEPANPGIFLEAGGNPDRLPPFPRIAKPPVEKRTTTEERSTMNSDNKMPEITMPPADEMTPGASSTKREANSGSGGSASPMPPRGTSTPSEELPQATMPDMPMPGSNRKDETVPRAETSS